MVLVGPVRVLAGSGCAGRCLCCGSVEEVVVMTRWEQCIRTDMIMCCFAGFVSTWATADTHANIKHVSALSDGESHAHVKAA